MRRTHTRISPTQDLCWSQVVTVVTLIILVTGGHIDHRWSYLVTLVTITHFPMLLWSLTATISRSSKEKKRLLDLCSFATGKKLNYFIEVIPSRHLSANMDHLNHDNMLLFTCLSLYDRTRAILSHNVWHHVLHASICIFCYWFVDLQANGFHT